MRLGRACALALVAVALVACGDDPVRILDGVCSFGDEHRLAVPDGPIVDDVALAADGDRVTAVWSDRAGTFARRLDASGAPIAEAIRLGPTCDGGLAALVHEGTLLVACGRRGREGRDDEGHVQLYALSETGEVTTRATAGALGETGRGVALAVDGEGVVWLGWQRADGAHPSAWATRLVEGAMPERLSAARFPASPPALLRDGDRMVAAWAETWIGGRGDVQGRLMLRAGSRAARAVTDLAYDAALPVLRPGVDGDVVLGFRDRRPARSRPRFQIARVEGPSAALRRIESAAHANAAGESIALGCGGHVFVVAPRTHSRTERLVSVRRYTRELVGEGPELQIYEHGAAYEHADAACVDGHLVVLFASRRSLHHERASVRAVAVECASD